MPLVALNYFSVSDKNDTVHRHIQQNNVERQCQTVGSQDITISRRSYFDVSIRDSWVWFRGRCLR